VVEANPERMESILRRGLRIPAPNSKKGPVGVEQNGPFRFEHCRKPIVSVLSACLNRAGEADTGAAMMHVDQDGSKTGVAVCLAFLAGRSDDIATGVCAHAHDKLTGRTSTSQAL